MNHILNKKSGSGLICSYNQPTWIPTQSYLCSVYTLNSLLVSCHPSSTIRIFLITNHQPLFHICITLPVESAPFFIPSTSFCSLSSLFTSSCAYHLITVTTFALITSLPLPFTRDLKLLSFTNPFLHSHSYSFRTDFTDLNLYWIKGALPFVLVSGYVC